MAPYLSFSIYAITALSLCSCDQSNELTDNMPIQKLYNHALDSTVYTISKEVAAQRLQAVLDAIYSDSTTRNEDEQIKTVNLDGIISVSSPITRGTEEKDFGLYVIPFNEGGYSIVSADCRLENDIFSIIPDGNVSEKDIEKQMILAERQIAYEERLFNLEDYILTRKGYIVSQYDDENGCSPCLGDVAYNDRWENETGYTIWCDEPGDTTIYTVGYSNGDANHYISTFYIFDGNIIREAGDTSFCEADERALIAKLTTPHTSQIEGNETQLKRHILMYSSPDVLCWPFYEVMRTLKDVSSEAQSGLNAIDTSDKVSVEIHAVRANLNGKRILNYGITQRNGFNDSFPMCYENINGKVKAGRAPAGCAVVASAIVCLQQNKFPSNSSDTITSWKELGLKYEGSWRRDIGLKYTWTADQKKIMSRIMYHISQRLHADYSPDGTSVNSKKYVPKFFKSVLGRGVVYDYTENRIRNQVDRNAVNFVRGYDSGGIKKNGHCWAVTAYMKVTDKNKTQQFVYINTCYSSDASGWYTMNYRLGYRHRCNVIEY